MHITKINNNQAFLGLWTVEIKKTNKTVKEDSRKVPIYKMNTTYHPFNDESEFITKGELNMAKRARVYRYMNNSEGCFLNKSSVPDCYIINKTTLGKKLNISEKDYKQIAQFEEEGYLSSDNFISYDNFVPKLLHQYPKEVFEMISME